MKFRIKLAKILNIGNSFLVTLPQSWIRQHKIESGEHLSMFLLQDGSLRLQPHLKDSSSAIDEIDVDLDKGEDIEETKSKN